jgi:hypothetical protein
MSIQIESMATNNKVFLKTTAGRISLKIDPKQHTLYPDKDALPMVYRIPWP